jgi:hypothetical protein
MDDLHSTFFTAAARIKIQKNASWSLLKLDEAFTQNPTQNPRILESRNRVDEKSSFWILEMHLQRDTLYRQIYKFSELLKFLVLNAIE